MTDYDIVVVGGGPAGLSSAIYALRAGKRVALIEKGFLGGQVAFTANIKNYVGFEKITGMELADKMANHAREYGLVNITGEVLGIEKHRNYFTVTHTNGSVSCKRIILCMGVTAKYLNVVGEREFTGKGVSYCATCDGNLFKNLDVAVVGGGDTAFEDILYLSSLCHKVYGIHRSKQYRANAKLQKEVNRLVKEGKVELITDSVVKEIKGDKHLTELEIFNTLNQQAFTLKVRGLFVAIGAEPRTDFTRGLVATDEHGYIKVNARKQTSVKGIYAAGDITNTNLRQIVTACADGAIAGSESAKSIH